MTQTRSIFLFDNRDYALLNMVNEMLLGKRSFSHTQEQLYSFFHPHGIKELAESKGLRIAYAVIYLLNLLEVGNVDDRLAALRSVRNEVIGATGGPWDQLRPSHRDPRYRLSLLRLDRRLHRQPSRSRHPKCHQKHDYRGGL